MNPSRSRAPYFRPHLSLSVLVLALLPGAIAACDAGDAPPPDSDARETGVRTDTGAPVDTGVQDTAAPDQDTLADIAPTPGVLAPVNQSGVRGRASLSGAVGGGLRVGVEAEGLEPGARYSAHVHEGRCADGGPIRLPLGRMTASQDGTASLRMSIDDDRLPADSALFVQIHGADDRPLACANVEREGLSP